MSNKNTIKNANKIFRLIIESFILILFIYFLMQENLNCYLLIASAIFFILSFLNPNLLTSLNEGWIKFGYLLGKFVSPIERL